MTKAGGKLAKKFCYHIVLRNAKNKSAKSCEHNRALVYSGTQLHELSQEKRKLLLGWKLKLDDFRGGTLG